MRLILSHYLRTLRERDEFDRLLPELLVAMGYVPLSKPQAGIRQFGVDFAAVGHSPDDGIKEILLFVIKQGNIGRREWSASEPADLRPSLDEVLDVFVSSHIPNEYVLLRRVVVVATTGELKQELLPNWTGYVEKNRDKASFHFWHGDKVAELLEKYLLDETLFASDDRQDLRKALALCGDRDYKFGDYLNVLRRQLGLQEDGSVIASPSNQTQMLKAMRRVNLAAQVCSHWARNEGDIKQALWVIERGLLWSWHRIQFYESDDRKVFFSALADMWQAYLQVSREYFEKMQKHFSVRDGMSGYCRENAEYTLVLFEHIGLVATVGLCQAFRPAISDEDEKQKERNALIIADALVVLLNNHDATASPRLDRHIVEINLALTLLVVTKRYKQLDAWLNDLAHRLNFNFLRKRAFPISTDSTDDLIDLEVFGDADTAEKLMSTSWTLPTIATWCSLRGLSEQYQVLSNGSNTDYSNVCGQLWHPTQDWSSSWYYENAQFSTGDAEAPFHLPENSELLNQRVKDFMQLERYDWVKNSQTLAIGLWALDFVACRHFKNPMPASFWYKVIEISAADSSSVTCEVTSS
ncbi:MAG: hypothetical protein Q7T66_10430 [Herminiimonas sp.]|uniref:hypothetical protein n=1 Tax=Herminiimonas sp. TaxID=1926289 RepID=UPI00271DF857|nr:hypothetical protein [Herminiimonas sp.]MDO9421069.1 hypothetical protein [Herminiimonas sp.]